MDSVCPQSPEFTMLAGAGWLKCGLLKPDGRLSKMGRERASGTLERLRKDAAQKAALKESRVAVEAAYKAHKDVIENVHKRKELRFTAIPLNQFSGGKPLYKSSTWNRRQSSEYRLITVGGKVAYARKSNHWGNIVVGAGHIVSEGRLYVSRLWDLEGGKNAARISQAGYILLEDLI